MAVLDATEDDINGLNLYAYCYNNPVNDRDDCGDLSWWKKLLIGVAVIVAVVAVAAITVATAGAGSAIAAVAIGAAKGAMVGAAVGAAQGAVIGGVTGYIEGGTAGILSGMVEGAADGFMIGAISGAVTGGIGGYKAIQSPNKALYNTSSSKVKAIDKVDDVARVHKNVDLHPKSITAGRAKADAGRSWGTTRKTIWKSEAVNNPGAYGYDKSNYGRMTQGKAPFDGVGKSYHLHHMKGKGADMIDVIKLTSKDHTALHKTIGYNYLRPKADWGSTFDILAKIMFGG